MAKLLLDSEVEPEVLTPGENCKTYAKNFSVDLHISIFRVHILCQGIHYLGPGEIKNQN